MTGDTMTTETHTKLDSSFIEEESATPFLDPNEIRVEANRYLFFAGDDLEPRRKRQVKHLRWGGIELELDYKCFPVTKGHIWRNMITPMTSGHELSDEQLVADEGKGSPVTTMASFGRVDVKYATRVHPGEEIRSLLFGKSDYPSKGLVEIKKLRDWDWKDVKAAGIQRFFFPEWDAWKDRSNPAVLPIQLSWTRKRIQDAMRETKDDTLISIGEDMLASCENFYAWGIDKLKVETTLVKTPPSAGSQHVYTYSVMSEQLFEMLEQQREDFLRQDFAAVAGNVQFSNADRQVEYDAMMKNMQATQDKIVELLANQLGTTAPPVEAAKPKTVLCNATKKNGEPCGAPPKDGTTHCVFHTVAESKTVEE